jgi:aryl-phospho-beta-D-glucosidase BglC (GH1 family)
MGATAVQLAAKIQLGWNIGNTMEAPGGERGWGNPAITEDYVKFVKQLGFNAIRIPCAWNYGHIDNPATAHIDPNWLTRVKEVIGYCINKDMYVLLNIHWDGGWLENNCTPAKKDSVNAKQKAFWEQIATTMRDFDERLMFASANEPNADDATKMGVLLSYHQTFINAVRSTGGRNSYRVLVIQGSSDLINLSAFPTDPTPNRMMYEEHNYTPYQFTALGSDASWGKMFYYWGAGHHSTIEPDRNATWGEETEQNSYFLKIKEKFVDKGMPVLMGEYGAYRRTTPKDSVTHNNAVDYWITYVTKQAISNGVKPFFWDTGGALDRRNNKVLDQRTIDAIIAGSK